MKEVKLMIESIPEGFEDTVELRRAESGEEYLDGYGELCKCWSYTKRRFIVLKRKRWRAELNGTYYYVTSDGSLGERKDIHNENHDYYHYCGNYFQYESEAREAQVKWKEIFTP